MAGIFITLEGVDGAGKTTQMELLARYLTENGFTVVTTKDPGGTPVGETIRHILLSPQYTALLDSWSELFLYLASRRVLVKTVIRPALSAGKVVICDRFTDSTLAYQGFGRGLSLFLLRRLCTVASDGLQPDCTFLLQIEPEEARCRIKTADRMENLGLSFQKKVAAGYLKLAKKEAKRIKVLDASGSPQAVFQHLVMQLPEMARGR